MPAFDQCVPSADCHFFPQELWACQCGLYKNIEEAKSIMEARKRIHESCIAGTCVGGRYTKPDMPECEGQLVRRCLRCQRTMVSICTDVTFCDQHGLHVVDRDADGIGAK